MDLSLLIIVAIVTVAGALVLFLALRGGKTEGDAALQLAELNGRMNQMARGQAEALGQISERMQVQERQLSKALEDRLGAVTKQITDTLEKSSQQATATMVDLRERLTKIDAAQKNIAELSNQVVSLQDILANKQAQGAFGEIQLKDLVTGVLPPSAYGFQVTLSNGTRADCLLKLPNPPGPIAVDAKFPLESYKGLRNAHDDAGRVQAGRVFSAAILKHVRDIAEKYIIPGETAEAALMFLPSEAIYAELHSNYSNVVEQSFRSRVFIVSPTTLWATLNTVRAVLKDVTMRQQAHVIQREVRIMLDDVGRLDQRVAALQRHFDQAGNDIREIRISTEKVAKRAVRIEELELEELGAGAAELPAPPPPGAE